MLSEKDMLQTYDMVRLHFPLKIYLSLYFYHIYINISHMHVYVCAHIYAEFSLGKSIDERNFLSLAAV